MPQKTCIFSSTSMRTSSLASWILCLRNYMRRSDSWNEKNAAELGSLSSLWHEESFVGDANTCLSHVLRFVNPCVCVCLCTYVMQSFCLRVDSYQMIKKFSAWCRMWRFITMFIEGYVGSCGKPVESFPKLVWVSQLFFLIREGFLIHDSYALDI